MSVHILSIGYYRKCSYQLHPNQHCLSCGSDSVVDLLTLNTLKCYYYYYYYYVVYRERKKL